MLKGGGGATSIEELFKQDSQVIAMLKGGTNSLDVVSMQGH